MNLKLSVFSDLFRCGKLLQESKNKCPQTILQMNIYGINMHNYKNDPKIQRRVWCLWPAHFWFRRMLHLPCQPGTWSCRRLAFASLGSHHPLTFGSTRMWPEELWSAIRPLKITSDQLLFWIGISFSKLDVGRANMISCFAAQIERLLNRFPSGNVTQTCSCRHCLGKKKTAAKESTHTQSVWEGSTTLANMSWKCWKRSFWCP